MKKIINLLLIFLLVSLTAVYAEELNFSKQNKDYIQSFGGSLANLEIKSIRQDPFPANPGEYTDIYFKIENTGGEIENPKFELLLDYPLSVYGQDNIQTFPSIGQGEKITLHYKIKVDEKALSGDYEAEFRAYTQSKEVYYPYYFDIKVDDTTTDFDVALQEVTKEGASIAISNVGKNPANSITIRIEEQEDFNLYGPDSYIIGNLNNGDYTILNVLIAPKENAEKPVLKVDVVYTDTTGNRRTVVKDINIPLNSNFKKGFEELTGFMVNGNEQEQNNGSSAFKYISLILLIVIISVIIYYKRKKNDEDEE